MIIGIGTSTASMYDLFVQIHQEGVLLATGFAYVSVLILVFGVFYVINIFYFAQDIDFLLPLPIKPAQLISAKFCVTLLYEYLTVIMFLLPLIVAYGIKSSGGLLFFFYSFLILLTIPVIPLVVSSIIVMFIMQFSNLTKRKDQFRIFAAIIGIILVLVINYFIKNYLNTSGHPEKALDLLKSGSNAFVDTASKIFPTAKIATDCLLNYSVPVGFIYLISFYLVNAIGIIILIFTGEILFLGTKSDNIIISIILAIGMFITASNGITASAISREGSNFFINKYLPISYKKIIFAKLFSGILFSLFGFIIVFGVAGFLFNISFAVLIISFILSLFGIILTAQFGLLLDINYPKLVWDNEYKPIKQNWNVVIGIFVSILFGACIIYLAFVKEMSIVFQFLVLILLLALMNLIIFRVLISKGTTLLSSLEDN
jgi:hypothetical protein